VGNGGDDIQVQVSIFKRWTQGEERVQHCSPTPLRDEHLWHVGLIRITSSHRHAFQCSRCWLPGGQQHFPGGAVTGEREYVDGDRPFGRGEAGVIGSTNTCSAVPRLPNSGEPEWLLWVTHEFNGRHRTEILQQRALPPYANVINQAVDTRREEAHVEITFRNVA